jgi:hypothetical protein
LQISDALEFDTKIAAICDLNWEGLTAKELLKVARAYYYFSIQFRENLTIARGLYSDDDNLRNLEESECNTDNLSPWPEVAQVGEKIDHDEFMHRLLALSPIAEKDAVSLQLIGETYLQKIRTMNLEDRARSIASYEDGGLERVFKAILRCRDWQNPALQAFRHFLVKHIQFDSDAENGHGALSRHLKPTDHQVEPFWTEFRRILVESAPTLLD